jgi:hypothetical protein
MAAEIGIRNGIRSAFRNSDSLFGIGNYGGGNSSIFFARVSFVLLDDSNKDKFDKYGGWKGIGTIECTPFVNNHSTTDVIVATPVTANLNIYPVINEVVVIMVAISPFAQGNETAYDPQYYYTQVLSAWNNPEHNAVPNNNWADNGANLVTGLFNQNGKVPKIIKAPGDITLEGRSGNFIRMGSSIKDFKGPFNGPDRSPVVTIVNKYRELPDYKVGSYEDINLDGSSLYMLNGHNVNFIPSSLNFDSYKEDVTKDIAPTQPSPKTAYVETIAPKGEPEKVVDPVVDTIPETKPVVNTANPEKQNTKSVVAGDDTELEEREFPEEFFTQNEIDEFVDLKECSDAAPVDENDLPSNDSDVPASAVYTNSIATTNIGWELQEGKTWCYVASLSMILKSYKINTSQTNIYSTSVIKGGKYDGSLNSYKAAQTYGVSYRRQDLPAGKSASYNAILQTIKSRNGKPFILQRKGISSKNHFVVVVGLNAQNRIVILDPGKKEYKNGTYLSMDNLKESGGSLRFFDK